MYHNYFILNEYVLTCFKKYGKYQIKQANNLYFLLSSLSFISAIFWSSFTKISAWPLRRGAVSLHSWRSCTHWSVWTDSLTRSFTSSRNKSSISLRFYAPQQLFERGFFFYLIASGLLTLCTLALSICPLCPNFPLWFLLFSWFFCSSQVFRLWLLVLFLLLFLFISVVALILFRGSILFHIFLWFLLCL